MFVVNPRTGKLWSLALVVLLDFQLFLVAESHWRCLLLYTFLYVLFFFFFNVTKVERSFVLFIVYHFNTANQHLYSHYITNTESPNMLFEYMCSHFCVVSHTLSEVIFEYSLICCDPQSSEDDSESSLLCCDTDFQR